MSTPSIVNEPFTRLKQLLESLEYGTVLITVHDSRIVQIERTEKHRFPLEPLSTSKNHSSKEHKK